MIVSKRLLLTQGSQASLVFRQSNACKEAPVHGSNVDNPEHHQPNVMIYAGKAHPQLSGADLVVTYATNTGKFSEHLTNPLSYYPHFVRLTRCESR